MAMIKCPECGREISDRADMCLGCGISQKTLREILAEKADMDAGEVEKNVDTESKNATAKELSIKSVVITMTTVETYKRRTTLKSVHCAICNNSYQAEEEICPKCKYPLLSFCDNGEKMKLLVGSYRKEAGVETVAPVKKSTAANENTTVKKNTAVKNMTEQVSQSVKKKVNLQVGQYHKMGYYQGEEINWRVLAVEGGKALLISEKGLDVKPYNKEYEDITWERCTLRKWLNREFYKSVFTSEEKTGILKTSVTTEMNPKYKTDPGRNTLDKVFLLSIQETDKYFKNDADRKVYPTEVAKNNGAQFDDRTKCCWWWLRSPGYISSSVACVDSSGRIDNGGRLVSQGIVCVRPTLWINLESEKIIETDNSENLKSTTDYLEDYESDYNDYFEDNYDDFLDMLKN